MAQEHASLTFSIYHAGQLVREIGFDRPIINLGKLSTSDLRVDDVNVSRKHAVIERRENGEWRITDLGSTNGTTVNGRQVTQATLHDGDRILLGNTTLVAHLSEEAQAAAAASGDDATGGAPPTSRPQEEIQGLGETTFYEEEQGPRKGQEQALEVALLWGETVLSIEHFTRPEAILVGEKPGSRFTIPEEALGTTSYPLVEVKAGKFALNLANPEIQGDVLVDGSVMPLGELSKEGRLDGQHLPIDGPMRARLRLGDFILLVSYGPMPEKPRISPLGSVDYTPHIYITLSAILHIAFLVFLSLMPEEQLRTQMDPRQKASKMIDVLKVSEEEEKEEEEEEAELDDDETGEGEDEMAVDEVVEQEMDKPEDSLVDKLSPEDQKKKDDLSDLSPEERQEKAREMAATAGAAAALTEQSALMDSLLESDDPAMMMDGKRITALTSKSDSADPIAGGGAIDPFGGGTLAPGAGGFAGTQSVGGNPGGGPGGPAVAGLGKDDRRNLDDIKMKEREVEPVAIASNATVSGRLDRKTVQQIIRRNMSGIRWCYQDALQRQSGLRGKVTLSFTILPNGRVQGEKAIPQGASVDDSEMLRCIQRNVGRLRFPSPKGGGLVKVSYPVILKTR